MVDRLMSQVEEEHKVDQKMFIPPPPSDMITNAVEHAAGAQLRDCVSSLYSSELVSAPDLHLPGVRAGALHNGSNQLPL